MAWAGHLITYEAEDVDTRLLLSYYKQSKNLREVIDAFETDMRNERIDDDVKYMEKVADML